MAAYESGSLVRHPFELRNSLCSTEKVIDSLIHERIERVDTSEHNVEFAAQVIENGYNTPIGACGRSAVIYIYLFLRKFLILSLVFD